MSRLSLALACIGLALAAAPSPLAAQNGDTVSALEGVYTDEQADRGRRIFDRECVFCHAPQDLSGTRFEVSWTNIPLSALYGLVSQGMPLDRPGTLEAAEYRAVIAYILRLNGYPAGPKELPTEPDSIGLIRVERIPDDGG